jgi:hypothetical protein
VCVAAVAVPLLALALTSTGQVDGAGAGGEASQFALLRSHAGAGLPAAFAIALAHAVAHAPVSYRLRPAAAREAATGTWVIPGATGLCLATRDSEGIGVRCASWQAARRGVVSFVVREQASGRERIVGVAPDGVRQVRAVDASGGTVALAPVRDNLYVVSARSVVRLDVE